MWPVIESVVYAADMALSRVEAVVIESLGESIGDPIQAAQVSISLFGSVARGDSTLESDVDLLIVFPTTFADDLVQNAIDGVSVAVTQSTGNPCNIYAATSERFTQLVTSGDAMVSSWDREARTFHGPDVRRMIRDARGNV
ncbi:MAG: nucleotidyltransferase protein [Subtercola sp.]|nr:nucleotidyltransferase protein [Subtercola sp.]